MLAGAFTTGVNEDFDGKELLRRAIANLEKMAFFGLTERYQDSMLMLKRTFPGPLANFRK